MKYGPTQLLFVSGGLEIAASCFLGFLMLLPMQPWASRLRARMPSPRALMSVHLDLVMLALMQLAAGAGIYMLPADHAQQRLAAILLVVSGWLNVTPYAWRMLGVNAFVLAGGALQRFAALLSLAGTLALVVGWLKLLQGWASSRGLGAF